MNRAVWAVMISVVCAPFAFAQTDAERGQAFILESKRLFVAERLDRAVLTIQNSTDDAVVAEAVTDLAQFWNNPEDKLAVIEDVLSKADKKSKTFQRAELAKARTLARLGQKAEAHAIFEKAIADGNEKALHFYHNSFWETGDYAKVAIDTYKRLAESAQDDPTKYEKERDFVGMFDSLRAMRAVFPESSAIKEVYSQLNDSEVRPLAKPLAEVVCLSADDRYGEALAALDKVQELLKSGKYTGPDEGKNVAFLRVAVLFFEGRDFDAARGALRKYLELNKDNPGRALCRLSFFSCAMEQSADDARKMIELTSPLMSSELLTDERIKGDLKQWELQGILSHHWEALMYHHRWDESRELSLRIMDNYYPQTLSGTNIAKSFAHYISLVHNDLDGAERLYYDILERAPYDGIVPHTKFNLARLQYKRGNYILANQLLNDIEPRLGPLPFGNRPTRECREMTRQLRALLDKH